MSHSFTKIWLHAVFSTKDRSPLILDKFESELHDHLKQSLSKKFEIEVRAVNGMQEHVHIVFRLNPNFSLIDIMKYIKGESSHWVIPMTFQISNLPGKQVIVHFQSANQCWTLL